MVTAGKRKPARPVGRLARLGVIATALGAQVGCTREFFREWANQDVSEAVFEKRRDPQVAARHVLDRAARALAVRGPLRPGLPPRAAGRPGDRGALSGPAVARQPADRAGGGDRLSRSAGEMEERAGRRGGDDQQRRLDPSAGAVRADRDPARISHPRARPHRRKAALRSPRVAVQAVRATSRPPRRDRVTPRRLRLPRERAASRAVRIDPPRLRGTRPARRVLRPRTSPPGACPAEDPRGIPGRTLNIRRPFS